MADEVKYDEHVIKSEECAPVESSDRGIFDFVKKDEEKKCEDEKIAYDFEHKVQVCEEKKDDVEEKKHEGLLEKLHRTSSSSSSSSDEEEVDEHGEKKKKKKKGLKEKVKDKITGDKEEEKPCEDTSVPVEKYEDVPAAYDHPPAAEEKKGFLEKIKDKLPGGKKAEEAEYPPPPPPVAEYAASPTETEGKEKKGFLDKIKEKIPGFKSDDEKEKEKEKEAGACQ